MRSRPLNRENRGMRLVTAIALLAAVVAIAACGSGGNKSSSSGRAAPAGGTGRTVTAVPTNGELGPAIVVTPSGSKQIGNAGKISPKENHPTDAQQHGVAGGPACASGSAMPASSNLNAVSASILCLLNAERASHGMPGFHLNSQLSHAAGPFARLMVAKRFFAHESGSSTPLSRIRRTGYVHGRWQIGENIAWGSGALATPQAIVNGWMHSPGHRANILHAAFRDIGIGVTLGAPGPGLSGGAVYVTDFGRHS
jgi:uncharacterized protein YkwD